MNDRGQIVACDVSERGLVRLAENARRLGLDCIRTQVCDATQVLPGDSGGFDRVLVDAPCSGLGTLRGHPEIRWHRTGQDLRRLAALQAGILDQAATRVCTGGLLVYATCTLSRVENEHLVEAFAERRRDFVVEETAAHLPDNRPLHDRRTLFACAPPPPRHRRLLRRPDAPAPGPMTANAPFPETSVRQVSSGGRERHAAAS